LKRTLIAEEVGLFPETLCVYFRGHEASVAMKGADSRRVGVKISVIVKVLEEDTGEIDKPEHEGLLHEIREGVP
jgi:hypothetical protein